MPKNDNKDISQTTVANTITELNKDTTSSVYGVSQDFINNSMAEINKIKDTVKRISIRNSYITGDNPIDFLTKMAYNDQQNKSNILNYIPKDKNGKIDLNKFMNGMTLAQVNEMYAQEMDRISTYDDYRAIVRYIPQVSQAINVWKDEIISPDDFTKNIFDIIYDDPNNVDLQKKVESNINNILTPRYNIEDKVDYWISETLILGDQFIAVLKLEDEFNKFFQESTDLQILDESTTLTEDSIQFTDKERTMLIEEYNKHKNPTKTDYVDDEKFLEGIKNEVIDTVNTNIKFSTSPMTLMEDEIPIIVDFQKEANKNKYSTLDPAKMTDAINTGLYEKKKSRNNIDAYVNGSYIKTLEPERVVKIKIGEVVYGYIYIEVRGKNELVHPRNVYSALTLRQTVDLTSADNSAIDDPKIRMVVDLFARTISKKIDKDFIADNKEFKNIIYELVHNDYIYNNHIQVTFFEPTVIKHLMIKEDKDGYGISILRDILFTAKLYLSVLISTLLTKISRAQDHRTFFIETGLSEDVEGIVNAFIRDVETKDVKLADTQSIDTIFSTIGSNSNFYIPVVNGERAVDIDTTAGLNVDMDNDLLDYLRKAMISGMGVPSQMLNYSDEMEFARSVSMQNQMFLRSVISKQKKLTPPFTSMYQDLYSNEFGNSLFPLVNIKEMKKKAKDYKSFYTNNEKDITNDKEDTGNSVDIHLIKAKFPSPSSLNTTNLGEQITNAQTVVQAITEIMFNTEGEVDTVHKHQFTLQLCKEYMPNVDWEKMKDMYESSRITAMTEKMEDNINKGTTGQE